ncbi:Sulfate-transporting ATPase [[Leptolyngbya] sp. PCC 7376]|uniref:daunorubicin resistance protein DrrA family ABC transporter ATP-binding protein n=1 Tax=[Leptolyngbya] sp. PCC 7376 TaxID=111781 RepID=UPI00029EDD89|nr:daunorubicin resistance protein DrrA family ABC transporter ATP-binding protein [[Leptolyngbya] sp. PCC 7376]AFY40000.1 Sulfate-transporting ATPase [[Leptolyngbya] sp. PCC 7376]
MTVAVAIHNLQKSYGTNPAVKDVSFEVERGTIFGLLGPNGAGKTTTIRCLCTLARPDAGNIDVCGISALAKPKAVRQRLGYVAQEVAIDKILTGRELLNLQAALYHLPKKFIPQRVEQLLGALGLAEYGDQKTGTYSGGLRKRLDLAAGLLHQPDVLVLDEPTVGLDIESRVVVWDFLQHLRAAGTTVIITSHYLEEIDALADNLAIIDKGKVIAAGTPNELKDKVGGDRVTLRIQEFTSDEEAQKATEVIEKLDFVETVIINGAQGNSLNLVVSRQGNHLSAIEQTIQSANLPIFSLSQSRPSLDDVYLAATGQTLMDADLAAAAKRDLKKEKKQQMKA